MPAVADLDLSVQRIQPSDLAILVGWHGRAVDCLQVFSSLRSQPSIWSECHGYWGRMPLDRTIHTLTTTTSWSWPVQNSCDFLCRIPAAISISPPKHPFAWLGEAAWTVNKQKIIGQLRATHLKRSQQYLFIPGNSRPVGISADDDSTSNFNRERLVLGTKPDTYWLGSGVAHLWNPRQAPHCSEELITVWPSSVAILNKDALIGVCKLSVKSFSLV